MRVSRYPYSSPWPGTCRRLFRWFPGEEEEEEEEGEEEEEEEEEGQGGGGGPGEAVEVVVEAGTQTPTGLQKFERQTPSAERG